MLFLAIIVSPNGPKMVYKGLQVSGRYDPMYELKNEPLTKSLGPLLKKKWSKTTRKKVLFLAILGPFGQMDPNGPKKAQCFSLRISP
jgi:hypothetical protein